MIFVVGFVSFIFGRIIMHLWGDEYGDHNFADVFGGIFGILGWAGMATSLLMFLSRYLP